MVGNQLEEAKIKTQKKTIFKKMKPLWETQVHLQMIKKA
jgi:hypothetical protein